ncbi:tyrosine--tRNA ligase [Jannaschia aquimarina]|uniref:Tyrosine--tRNA ligase n=1 Tax=Jannaschia aquimarina TaxID=935700 RepID=A0A0D1EAR4_9RHOB|nr:tyrosine--tRNA ligase [Jannaschia aquimarina]KIT14794.1 Tyrosine--tRNA ligase [Jannaschia aquimarina]SNS85331.1 tyrosyl-tRNA synthetase [Jannaschia aquimarina]
MLYPLLKNVAIAEPEEGLKDKLELAEKEGRPLRVKLGFDPTAPDLHLGHAVVLQKLRDFQEAGHTIVVIIGDFTASIGDPTGRNKLRPPLSAEEIDANAETYLAQLGKVVDTDRIEVRRNSEWHGKLSAADILKLMAQVTVAQIMTRDDFRKRFSDGLPIHLHELLYPILQGYDSVMIDADIELGGTDQLFNNLMGRHLQEAAGKPGQAVLTMPLLVGTDGSEKMSKSKANYVGLTDAPEDMFGKLMSISDAMLPNYIELTGDFGDDARRDMLRRLEAGENPMAIKKALAANVTDRFHGAGAGADAQAHFERTVQQKAPEAEDHTPLHLSDVPAGATLLDLCATATPTQSRGALKRLIAGGGVRLDGEKMDDPQAVPQIKAGRTLWIGKRDRFLLT